MPNNKVLLPEARKKFSRHKAQSKYRNIGFYFTFDEWYSWWLNNGVDKNIDTFDLQDTNRLCMCRYNDSGPYEISNVYCASQVDNVADAHNKGGLKHRRVTPEQQKAKQKAKLLHQKKQEWKKLCVRYRLEIGTPNQNMWWPTGFGTYVPSKQEAVKISVFTFYKYTSLMTLGILKRKPNNLTFEEFVKKYSQYNEPYSFEYREATNVAYHKKKTKYY